eukprot:jgi/Hompol1/6817/HPOL_003795-RA
MLLVTVYLQTRTHRGREVRGQRELPPALEAAAAAAQEAAQEAQAAVQVQVELGPNSVARDVVYLALEQQFGPDAADSLLFELWESRFRIAADGSAEHCFLRQLEHDEAPLVTLAKWQLSDSPDSFAFYVRPRSDPHASLFTSLRLELCKSLPLDALYKRLESINQREADELENVRDSYTTLKLAVQTKLLQLQQQMHS